MFLRLTFKGKLCPSEWSELAEPICDLSTALLHEERWDPTTLVSPSQLLVPPPVRNQDSTRPLGVGKELVVDVPINPRGTHDLYLDDIVSLTLDVPGSNNLDRHAGAHLLAIAATARPSHDEEPIPREPMEARNLLVAEATPEEIKLILGWTMDFRSLIISLPDNKYTAWSESIQQLLVTGSAKAKELETLIGDRPSGSFGHDIVIRVPLSQPIARMASPIEEQATPHGHAHGVPTRLRADDEVP